MPNPNEELRSPHFLDEIIEEVVNTTETKVETKKTEEQQALEKAAQIEQEEKEKQKLEEEANKTEEDKDKIEQEPTEESDDFSYVPLFQELVDSNVLLETEKEYEDSVDGLKEWLDDTKRANFQEYKESIVNPIAQQFIDFLESGGSPDEFIQRSSEFPDYANLNLEDEDTAKNVLRDHFSIQGYENQEIEDIINEYSEIGSLQKHAKNAQSKLIKHAEKEIEALTKEQKRVEAERIAKLEKEAEDLKAAIYESDNISGFKLTATDKDKFYQYLTKPVKQDSRGRIYTQSMLDTTEEDKLKMAYFKFRKFDLSEIENKAQSKAVQDLQKQLKKKPDTLSVRTTSQGEQRERAAISDVDMSWQ